MIVVDGSIGEGGGQILRTAVALAAILGEPVRIVNIRAKRSRPGLRPQHLNAIRAIASMTGGRLEGDRVGSMEVYFEPGRIKPGTYRIDIGTAGSVSLILQAVLPVAAYSPGPVRLWIRGGTDVPRAPTIDYMREVLARLLAQLGYTLRITVETRGHYPKGGGIVHVDIPSPPQGFKTRDFTRRGALVEARGRSHAVKLPRHVAERQARSARETLRRLTGIEASVEVEWVPPEDRRHLGPGSGVALWTVYEQTVLGGDSLGERGKPAEKVGREAAEHLAGDLATGAALDRHASDMIPLYLALAGGVSRVTGARLTLHARTVLMLLEQMLPGFKYKLEGEAPFTAVLESPGV